MTDYGKVTILGNVPSKANCYRVITINGHGSLGKTKALSAYERDFFLQVGHYRDLRIDDLFGITLDVYYPSMRSDLDNSLKVILDCLQKAGAILNDNKCVSIDARKFVDKENPRIEFALQTYGYNEQ